MLNKDAFIEAGSYATGIGLMPERSAQTCGFQIPADTIVVSADNHLVLAEDIWFERLPAHLKDKAPRIWRDDELGFPQLGYDGKSIYQGKAVKLMQSIEAIPSTWDIHRRMKDLDDEGVDKEIAFPQEPMFFVQHPDFELREWLYRTYNQYVAELQNSFSSKFFPVPIGNYWDPYKAAASVLEIKDLGLKTVMLPMKPGKSPSGDVVFYGSKEMDSFWSAIEEVNLPVSFHIGEQAASQGPAPMVTEAMLQMGGGAGMFRKIFTELAFGGVFDRHPKIKLFFAEGGIHWVPGCLQDVELCYDAFSGLYEYTPKQRPSHYWYEHCAAAFMNDAVGLKQIDSIGVDCALWSVDYGHNEGTFGYTRDSIKAVFDSVPLEDAKKIVGGNALKLFDI